MSVKQKKKQRKKVGCVCVWGGGGGCLCRCVFEVISSYPSSSRKKPRADMYITRSVPKNECRKKKKSKWKHENLPKTEQERVK